MPGAAGGEGEESEYPSALYETDQDPDRDGHQEREDRAEHRSRGNGECGPGWEIAHPDTAR